MFTTALTCQDSGSMKINHLKLVQAQAGKAYVFPMAVVLTGEGHSLSKVVSVRDKNTVADIKADRCYGAVELDPDQNLVIWRKGYATGN